MREYKTEEIYYGAAVANDPQTPDARLNELAQEKWHIIAIHIGDSHYAGGKVMTVVLERLNFSGSRLKGAYTDGPSSSAE